MQWVRGNGQSGVEAASFAVLFPRRSQRGRAECFTADDTSPALDGSPNVSQDSRSVRSQPDSLHSVGWNSCSYSASTLF